MFNDMLVYFVASRHDLEKRIDKLRHIVKTIHDEGHILAYDWLEPIYARNEKDIIDWPGVYKETIEAITRADVVIADTSIQSFGVGYQTAVATQLKKPTLLLHDESADSKIFAFGIPEANATHKKYNDKSVEDIVKKFLKENDIRAKDMRFNFFIDRPIYNYLRWSAQRTGKTKAEILRELVSKEIDKANNVDQL